jgi:hypothetical protein
MLAKITTVQINPVFSFQWPHTSTIHPAESYCDQPSTGPSNFQKGDHNYHICSHNLRTFFSTLAAEKSGCVKYAGFFSGDLDLGFSLV